MMFRPHIFDSVSPNGNLLARGRSYSDPIGDMVASVPPGTPLTPTAITAELFAAGFYLALINASMGLIMARIERNCANAARDVVEG